jgi:hypothetical protein
MLLSLLNPLNSKEHLVVKNNVISSYSTAKNMLKIAEVKLSRCGLEVADFIKNCNCGATFVFKFAELRLRKCFL